jgi:hypothetical protein
VSGSFVIDDNPSSLWYRPYSGLDAVENAVSTAVLAAITLNPVRRVNRRRLAAAKRPNGSRPRRASSTWCFL